MITLNEMVMIFILKYLLIWRKLFLDVKRIYVLFHQLLLYRFQVVLKLGISNELKVKEYDDADNGNSEKPNNQSPAAAKIAADSAKKFGASPETAGNSPIFDANQKDDKLPVQPAKAPEIENLTKITDAAAELLDQNDF